MISEIDVKQPLRILHIEDSPRDAELIQELLIGAGFSLQLDWATNEQQFKAFLKSGLYDLILADYHIPAFNGEAALKLAKTLCPDAPFICVSGAIGEEKAVQLMKLGATDYIMKNRLDKLALILQRALEEARKSKELGASEERFRVLVEQAPDAIIVYDFDESKILDANPSAEKLFGCECDELRRLGLQHFFYSPEQLDQQDTSKSFINHCEQALLGGLAQFEQAIRCKDGQNKICEVRLVALSYEKYRLIRGSFIDITERIHASKEKAKLEDQLRQNQKVEAIGRLAGGVAHDFNNMLSVILGYGENLIDQLHSEDPLQENAKQIVEAGKRSAALTRQLLAFSRKQTLQPKVLDINAVIKNLEKMLGRLISEDIELKLVLAKDLARVVADPGQIEQVIMNLAVNARDAMPQGGQLLIESANIELEESYAQDHTSVEPGNYVMIAVSDNGCGMDKQTLGQVFDPFFTTKAKEEGTGLGLSTVYGIAKQSGGSIWAYSEPGHGSTFKIYLPQTQAEFETKRSGFKQENKKGSGEHILVVEDETALRGLFKKMLLSLGYQVTVAANGGEALLQVEEGGLKPDLVISDVVMPGMGGLVLIERLRNNQPGLKVLFVSGYTDNAVIHHGILTSNIPFIQKPFGIRDLAAKVDEVLRLELET